MTTWPMGSTQPLFISSIPILAPTTLFQSHVGLFLVSLDSKRTGVPPEGLGQGCGLRLLLSHGLGLLTRNLSLFNMPVKMRLMAASEALTEAFLMATFVVAMAREFTS